MRSLEALGVTRMVRVTEPGADQVRLFLQTHHDFLESFVMEEVELEILERWMIRSTQRAKKRLDVSGTGKYRNVC